MIDDDDPDWDEADGDDDEPTVACPHCRAEVHEDAPRCPSCGSWITREDAPPSRKPWWVIVGAIACLYAVARWIGLLG